MYRPQAFDMTESAQIAEFIDSAGPAHLVTRNGSGMVASMVPLLLDRETNVLIGHLARPNPQWRDLVADTEALAIFTGPDAYISPSFYATKRETGRVVPTWNYELVHVYGTLVVHDDLAWVTSLVTRLTERHESPRATPWSVDDTPDGFIATMARGIVGVELRITRWEGKRKLSQNRSAADVDGAISGLDSGTDREQELATAMRRARRSTT